MKIVIGADIVPTVSNMDLFENGMVDELIGKELHSILQGCVFSIFNLEVPITDVDTPIKKNGPNLRTSKSSINGLAKINPHFFTLSNNHIMDHGECGYISTVESLKANGIKYSGVGKNLSEAVKPFVYSDGNLSIGIYCCSEHEFSIATADKPGANPFDPLESLDHINCLKQQCDFVIVLYHGGKEHYRYPSPYLQKVCRKMAYKGADLIICQHSHCIGCKEEINDSTIIYGQGNFLFDYSNNQCWQDGILLSVDISNDKKYHISYIPVVKTGSVVRIADRDSADTILEEFYKRSKLILDSNTVSRMYDTFAQENMWTYYKAFSGGHLNGLLYRLVNKLTHYGLEKKYPQKKYNKDDRIRLRNFIECEAHRELLLEGLKCRKNE